MDTGTENVKNHWFITLHSMVQYSYPPLQKAIWSSYINSYFLLANIYRKLCNLFKDKPSTQPVKILHGNALMSPSVWTNRMPCVCFAKVSDVYIRRDNFGVITPTRLITDNFVYFLTNGNASVTVNIDFECGTYFSWQEITVGLPLIALLFAVNRAISSST